MRRSTHLVVGDEQIAPFGGLPKPWLSVPARAIAWCAQRRLDREIASGADPFADPIRACEARKLSAMHTRRGLASAIESLFRDAMDPRRAARVIVPLHHRTILVAQPALQDLAGALVAPGPVGVRGVALARVLLADGGSPLFGKDSRALTDAVVQAMEELEDHLYF